MGEKEPVRGVAWPYSSLPQQATEPLLLIPQVWRAPALTETKEPVGGVAWPYSSLPQQATEPVAPHPAGVGLSGYIPAPAGDGAVVPHPAGVERPGADGDEGGRGQRGPWGLCRSWGRSGTGEVEIYYAKQLAYVNAAGKVIIDGRKELADINRPVAVGVVQGD